MQIKKNNNYINSCARLSEGKKKMIDISDIQIPHGTNAKEEELLEDLRKVVDKLGVEWLKESEYAANGQYTPNTIRNRFGSWENALQRIGLTTENKRFKHHLACSSEKALTADIRATAKRLGKKTITCAEYDRFGKYGKSCARNRLGRWDKVLEAAGLEETGFHNAGVTKEQLLEAIYEAWERLGRQPNTRDVRNKEVPYGLTTYINQFGSWRECVIEFVEYVKIRQGNAITTPPISQVKHTTGRTPSAKLRKLIFERDNATCLLCGTNEEKEPGVKLVIDHIIPYSKGGETTYDNLQVLCRSCNIEKNNKLINKTK